MTEGEIIVGLKKIMFTFPEDGGGKIFDMSFDDSRKQIKKIELFLFTSLRQYRQSIEEEMIKSCREGKICAYCGQAKEPNLTELCNECLEEN